MFPAKKNISAKIVLITINHPLDGLTWQHGDIYGLSEDDVYIGTPPRPDLFQNTPGLTYNLLLQVDVFLKFDTTTIWIPVVPTTLFNPTCRFVMYMILFPHFVHTRLPSKLYAGCYKSFN